MVLTIALFQRLINYLLTYIIIFTHARYIIIFTHARTTTNMQKIIISNLVRAVDTPYVFMRIAN